MPDGITVEKINGDFYVVNPHKLEPILGYLWEWFNEIAELRQEGMSGWQRLSWSDFADWKNLMQRDTTPFDINVINRLDREFIISQRKKD